ncbi:MAG: hypothetical protein HYX68_17360 [Planctomycetes bacterium]|nr:hypothetical protein [Planctomycetota bacterium]
MFSTLSWKSWFARFRNASSRTAGGKAFARPRLEQLEDRVTPSTLDLTSHGAIGSINGAIFRQFDAQPTGTGVIDSFLRIQSNKSMVQQGFNSDHRGVQFNENTSPQFTRSLLLDDVPVVNVGGVNYREFLLDINQKASQPLLSLDELRIYLGGAGNLSGYVASTQQLAGLNAVYDLDANGDNWIKLDARLNQGSGKGDMLAYIPDSLFTGGSYVYLYSKFGVNHTPNAGFEEWAAGSTTLTDATGSISGHVFNETTLAPIPGELIYIDANQNGALDNNEVFTFTDADGYYQFGFLATGLGSYSTYQVRIELIVPNSNGDVGTLSKETVGGEEVAYPYDVVLQTSGQAVTDVDFYVFFGEPEPPNS